MIDWDRIQYFAKDNFPEDPDKHADPDLLYKLDAFRTNWGYRIYPSPAPGALARINDPDSQHYSDGKGRLSRAVDVFPDCPGGVAFLAALASNLWEGIGLYLDTHFRNQPWDMLHLDLRSRPDQLALYWIRRQGEYIYPQNHGPEEAAEIVGRAILGKR
jgi:hypothetical protein